MINKSFILLLCSLSSHFLSAQNGFSDCAGAIILCNNDDLIVNRLDGAGAEKYEVGFTACSERLEEKNSVWIKWTVEGPGTLGFNIEPFESTGDIDFILYRLNGSIRTCSQKTILRCMSSGLNLGQGEDALKDSYACLGATGLSKEATATHIYDGCSNKGNFLSEVNANKGESYMLYVNNFYDTGGFRMTWTGTAKFASPGGTSVTFKTAQQQSKSVFFQPSGKTAIQQLVMENGSPLEKAYLGKLPQSQFINTFAGCAARERETEAEIKEELVIGQLFPNPATYQVAVNVNAPFTAMARIEVVDLLGRLQNVREVVFEKGEQVITLPTERFPEGIYAICIRFNGTITTRKLAIASLK